jgi:hypothetical protein
LEERVKQQIRTQDAENKKKIKQFSGELLILNQSLVCETANVPEHGFLTENFLNFTSETIKARPF